MKWKLIVGIILIFLSGMALGMGYVYFHYENKPMWILPSILIMPVVVYQFLYKKLIKPYQLIISGMKLLNEQDFSTRLRPVRNKEAREMSAVFNRMIDTLRNERLSVREKNQFLDLLIHASPQGIIILDFNECITDMNPAGQRILNISDFQSIKGKKLKDGGFELAGSLAAMSPSDDSILRSSNNAQIHCVRSSFVDKGFEHPFILIEELTRELLKIEKESYERVIRMMSHEVNNSVGAIGSTLNVISEILNQDDMHQWEDVVPAVDASSDRCLHLASFISNLAHVVKIPKPNFTRISLNEQARSVYALTQMECQRCNIRLTLNLVNPDLYIHADGIQMEQVFVNIVKNAYESIEKDGEININTYFEPLSIVIEDNGPGITEEVSHKLFSPFYTTKPAGHGIGLMFVRDVLTNHGCKFSLTTENGWTRFSILFSS